MSYASDLIEEEGLCEHGNASEFCYECNNSDEDTGTYADHLEETQTPLNLN